MFLHKWLHIIYLDPIHLPRCANVEHHSIKVSFVTDDCIAYPAAMAGEKGDKDHPPKTLLDSNILSQMLLQLPRWRHLLWSSPWDVQHYKHKHKQQDSTYLHVRKHQPSCYTLVLEILWISFWFLLPNGVWRRWQDIFKAFEEETDAFFDSLMKDDSQLSAIFDSGMGCAGLIISLITYRYRPVDL